jgi:hypothetical protein
MSHSSKPRSIWLAASLLLHSAAMPMHAVTITTNGNGEAVDVGIWYCANWDVNGGGWWPLSSYRPLLPNGQYGMHDGADPNVIDYHLQQLADAKSTLFCSTTPMAISMLTARKTSGSKKSRKVSAPGSNYGTSVIRGKSNMRFPSGRFSLKIANTPRAKATM